MTPTIQRLTVAAGLALAVAGGAQAVNLTGAGATFPYPIYSKWFDDFHKAHPDVEINYQSIGSGGGIKQITARTVDFGASDGPMSDKLLFAVDGKLLHIPTVMGAVVPAFNVPGVMDLVLSGDVLADIFLGKIKNWSDPRIKELNPGATLPDAPITVVHRSDGSGTTFCFVDYLSKVSAEWKKKVGKGTSVNWPLGLGGKGNEGVSGLVKQTPNAIGYVELIYAQSNNIAYASMKNKSGKVVKASLESTSAAANGVDIPADYRVSITDSPNEGAYPISTFTWLLVYRGMGGEKGKVMKDFLGWMIQDGQKSCQSLGYAPLPDNVKEMVTKTVASL